MKAVLAVLAVMMALSCAVPASAALTSAAIGSVQASPSRNAAAPMDLAFHDDQGRPATLRSALAGKPGVLIFADYTCTSLCGPALVLTKVGLEQSGLTPGIDYRIAVVGLNPKDGSASALKMRQDRLSDDPSLDHAASFLIGDPAAIQSATSALGYHYVYDPEHDQYAHPAVAYALRPDGRVAHVVSEIGLTGPALKSALIDAAAREPASISPLAEGLHILCYGFDPAKGLYNGAAITALRVSALGAFAIGAFALYRLGRRRSKGMKA